MKRTNHLVIGTRGSKLALAQTDLVADALRQAHPELQIDIEVISTKGDRILDAALSKVGDKGLFVTEIEQALCNGGIDLAVHSAKDLPSQLAANLILGAIPTRADVRDVLVTPSSPTLSPLHLRLSKSAHVGSSSLRRASQLRALRPDLRISDVRGNVDTRLRKLAAGHYDAIILAAAGLHRLGLRGPHIVSEDTQFDVLPFDLDQMLPAVAQGALAIECRADDVEILRWLSALDDPATHACVDAERGFLRRLEGGCQVPIAAYAEIQGERLYLQGLLATLDGSRMVRGAHAGQIVGAVQLGEALADQLLAAGGSTILDEVRRHVDSIAVPSTMRPLEGARIVVTRPEEHANNLNDQLEALGARVLRYPVIDYAPPEDQQSVNTAMHQLVAGEFDWLVLTSVHTVRVIAAWLHATDKTLPVLQIAVVGEATAATCIEALGVTPTHMPEQYDAAHLVEAMSAARGQRVLLMNADIAQLTLQQALERNGAYVRRVIAYRTVAAAKANIDIDLPALLRHGEVDAITFTSGSTVRFLVEHIGADVIRNAQVALVCIGPMTAQIVREHHLGEPITAVQATHEGLIGVLIKSVFRKSR